MCGLDEHKKNQKKSKKIVGGSLGNGERDRDRERERAYMSGLKDIYT